MDRTGETPAVDAEGNGPNGLPYRPCAGVVLVNPAGLVFAGRRNDRPSEEPAAWQMPQGGVDPGEGIVTAALRELEEETGIPSSLVRVKAVAPRPVTYDIPEDRRPAHWKGRWRGWKT